MDKKEDLDKLKRKMQSVDLPLKKGATNLVFGIGDSNAKILFIGEGPGYWEDLKAEPFVGNAGKLLDSLLQSIKLERNKVYITNVVHHRPPENRDPQPEEIGAYAYYLDKIIDIIEPRIIVTLGRFSMGKFLPNTKITSVHGRCFEVNWNERKIKIIPMFHPAAALRSLEVMRMIKEDFQKIPEILKEVNSKVEIDQLKLV